MDFAVNTFKGEYYIQLRKVYRFSIIFDEDEIFFFNIRIFFINFNIHPLQLLTKPEKNEKKKKEKEKKKRRERVKSLKNDGLMALKLTWRVIDTFKLKKIELSLDTTNVITNAYLIPVFAILNGNRVQLNINYIGDTGVIIKYENTLFRILFATIKSYLKHKKRKLKT
ncbi:MAG: hypothetical protein DRJ05_12160 [Bacteroidetes bacterium]|nr:MAG: hypothetical protein DRJ05_12160 [Bacteroidota bacterium]